MGRICIFVIYDDKCIVYKYIKYILEDLKRNVDKLVVVCNMQSVLSGKEYLADADEVYYRENIGLDAGAFKDALCQYVGWDELVTYDELLMINDSFYGPFVPISDILDEMKRRDVDFWGLSKHLETKYKKDNGDWNYVPEHIQSYFLSINKKMLSDGAFQKYWENMPYFSNFDEVVEKHEKYFTQSFSELGYRYDCLADIEANRTSNSSDNYIQYSYIPYELIKERNFPIIKRKAITNYTLYIRTQENIRKAVDYVDKNTSYDIGLIWEHLLAKTDMTTLWRSLNLTYILDPCLDMDLPLSMNMVVLVIAEHQNAVNRVCQSLDDVRDLVNIHVLAVNEDIKKKYENNGYKTSLVDSAAKKNDILKMISSDALVLYIRDLDFDHSREREYSGRSLFFNRWDNLLDGKEYIKKINKVFVDNKNLGLLLPPYQIHGVFFENTYDMWGEVKDDVLRLCRDLELIFIPESSYGPFAATDSFWIRGAVLKRILEEAEKRDVSIDFNDTIVQKALIYIAQNYGYYSGVVESKEYASMAYTNLQFYMQVIGTSDKKAFDKPQKVYDIRDDIYEGAIADFILHNKAVYVYGIGKMAEKYIKMPDRIKGYIISDGQKKPDEYKGKPVFNFSEIKTDDDTGIIICLGNKNREVVERLLIQNGITRYISVGD